MVASGIDPLRLAEVLFPRARGVGLGSNMDWKQNTPAGLDQDLQDLDDIDPSQSDGPIAGLGMQHWQVLAQYLSDDDDELGGSGRTDDCTICFTSPPDRQLRVCFFVTGSLFRFMLL